MMNEQARLTELEEKFAHLERHVEQLDEVLREHIDRSDRHADEVRAMREAVALMREALLQLGDEHAPES